MKIVKLTIGIISLIIVIIFMLNFLSIKKEDQAKYTYSLLNKVKWSLLDESDGLVTVLPEKIPHKITGWVFSSDGERKQGDIILADPFNKQGKLLKANGATRDYIFSYSGAKLTYKRLSDKLGLVYSYGPDLDDDIEKISDTDLIQWVRTDKLSRNILNSIYDPTNGLNSNGDITKPINIETTRSIE